MVALQSRGAVVSFSRARISAGMSRACAPPQARATDERRDQRHVEGHVACPLYVCVGARSVGRCWRACRVEALGARRIFPLAG
jgi:hypothetical protein